MNYALVLGMHGAGFWRFPYAQDGQSPGPVFLCLSLHWQKSDNGFYFTHIQICNKMPNSVRIVQTNHHFVHVAFLNLEIVQLSHCLALPACYPSLFSAHYGSTLMPAAPLRDSQPHCWQPWPALEAEVWLGVSGVPLGLHALSFPTLPWSRLWASWQGDLWNSQPPTPDPSWLRNSHTPGSLKCPGLILLFPQWQRRLSKMLWPHSVLNKDVLRH